VFLEEQRIGRVYEEDSMNLFVKVLVLLIFTIVIGCLKVEESHINLNCQGQHTSIFESKVEFVKPWNETLSFKDKRRYSIERERISL
jgi:hypothetical protein